jgi:hypothetical protein
MAGHIGSVQELAAFLPRLRQVLSEQGVLLVLDNLETLLTAEGTWRDPRWDPLIAALTGHDGESRLIMTSRTVPRGQTGTPWCCRSMLSRWPRRSHWPGSCRT